MGGRTLAEKQAEEQLLSPHLRPERSLVRRWQVRTQRFRRRLQSAFIRACVFVVVPLPFAITRRVFPLVTGLVGTAAYGVRIERNLELAYGDALPAREKHTITRRVCANLGLLAAEILADVRNKLPPGYIADPISQSELEARLGSSTGFVLVSAHLGNWEALIRVVSERWPDRVRHLIAARNPNDQLSNIIVEARRRLGMDTLFQDASPRRSIRSLQHGGIVAVVPDQDVKHLAGIFLPFLGKRAYTPSGPAYLAWKAGVPIVPCFAHRTAKGLLVEWEEPIWPRPEAPRDEEIERLTSAWSSVVEKHVQKQPSDWMWIHQRWRTTPESLARRHERRRERQSIRRQQAASAGR